MSDSQDFGFYPGSTVLRNKPGITDEAKLREFEYGATLLRQADAPTFPMTAQGFKDTHKHLFQDVYDWAGEARAVNMRKEDSSFAAARMVDPMLEGRFQQLRWNNNLQDLSADRFASAAAEHIAELNRIHTFREGNGRAMRLHLEQLATQAGHQLDSRRFDKVEWDAASVRAFDGSRGELARVIAGAMAPAERISVDAAIGRTRELHAQAVEDVRDRTKEIRDLINRGNGSTITSKELTGLREEMAAIGSPDNNSALTRLQQLRDAGGKELTVLTAQATSARDQLHALREGADRALRAPVQASTATAAADLAPSKATTASAAAAPVPKQSAASYWNSIASAGKQQGPTDVAPSMDQTRGPRR